MIVIILWLILLVGPSIGNASPEYPYNHFVDQEIWQQLTPYFLPKKHPVKQKLDRIFNAARATQNEDTMRGAGFQDPYPRKWTRLVVTTHPKMPGYIFKLYLDKQSYHEQQPEYYFWKKRIQGANLIREEINKRQLNHLFKVPHKWIYPLPEKPSPPKKMLRKNFILVEKDMDLYSATDNAYQWQNNPMVNQQFLFILHKLLDDLGMWDCAKIENAPFSKDGRIAFIDTQSTHRWPVKLYRLTPFLRQDLQSYWESL